MSNEPPAAPTYAVGRWLAAPTRLAESTDLPDRLAPLISALSVAQPDQLSSNDPPATLVARRQAAVLILIGDSEQGPKVVLLQRNNALRDHPGEVAFPGGARENTDRNPVVTALRETAEEMGIDPNTVVPLIKMTRLFIRASGYDVTAVVAYWRRPGPIRPIDPMETSRVFTVSLTGLADSERWHNHRIDGWNGPATFIDANTRLWGFTGELIFLLVPKRLIFAHPLRIPQHQRLPSLSGSTGGRQHRSSSNERRRFMVVTVVGCTTVS